MWCCGIAAFSPEHSKADYFYSAKLDVLKTTAANGYSSLDRLSLLGFESVLTSRVLAAYWIIARKMKVCIKYATFLNFRHIISIKVVVLA